nr:hypothetical protein [Longibacter salinarum]
MLKFEPLQPESGALRRGTQIDKYIDITVRIVLLPGDGPVQRNAGRKGTKRRDDHLSYTVNGQRRRRHEKL